MIGPLAFLTNVFVELPILWPLYGLLGLFPLLPIAALSLLVSACRAKELAHNMALTALCVVNASLFLGIYIPIVTVCWGD